MPMEQMSSTSGGLGAKVVNSYLSKNISNQHVVAERNENLPIAQPLPHWIYRQQPSHNQANFSPESSTEFCDIPARDVAAGVLSPVGSIQVDSSFDALKARQLTHIVNGNDPEASSSATVQHGKMDGENYNVPMAVHLRPLGEGEVENKLMDVENQNLSQNHASSKKESNEDTCNVFQPYPEVTIAVSGSPSKLCGSVSRKRASSRSNITDRLRRARIGQGFKALRELLPHFKEGNKASLLDNVIDYVKYLQFQIKVLSQSKLGGEAINAPLVHLEGYGHYLLNQQMLKEPLEEIMGRLMEVDMGKATQLLQSKGLAVIEDSLAEKLFQAG